MQNYERLIIDLLPANLTPKAKYEFLQHLLWTKKVHTAAKEKLEYDLNWFGPGNVRYMDAKNNYDILMGASEQPEETKHQKQANAMNDLAQSKFDYLRQLGEV